MQTASFKSEDIHCQTCASRVKAALDKVEGVQMVTVNVPEQTVSIEFDQPASEDSLRFAMDEAGFTVSEN